jgi:hypothetical protein
VEDFIDHVQEDPMNAIGTGGATLGEGNEVIIIDISKRQSEQGGEARGVDRGNSNGGGTSETHD